ncbi:MAG: nucleotidyltransferase family protein [Patescibacteria group bacterium]
MSKELEKSLEVLRQQKPYLQKAYHVKELGVFGSFARGDFTDTSDMDVLVDFCKSPSLLKYIHLENYLTEQLGRKVDLVHKPGLKRAIKDDVLSEVVYV